LPDDFLGFIRSIYDAGGISKEEAMDILKYPGLLLEDPTLMGQLMESFELENPILSEIDTNIKQIDPKELVSDRFIAIVKCHV